MTEKQAACIRPYKSRLDMLLEKKGRCFSQKSGRLLLRVVIGGQVEEILEQLLTVPGEDRLGMELNAVDGIIAMAHTHDLAFSGLGVNDQDIGNRRRVDQQGVIARGLERAGQSGKNAGGVVQHGRGLAVHESSGPHHHPPIDMSDALMTEAHAEHWQLRPDLGDDFVGDARFLGRAGPGRNDDGLGLQCLDGFQRDLVVALHNRFRAELTKVLDEVVGERIVVIDNEEHEKK